MEKNSIDALIIGIQKDISYIREKLSDLEEMIRELAVNMKKDYVTKEEFSPVRSLVYGMVGFILVAFLGALIALVIK